MGDNSMPRKTENVKYAEAFVAQEFASYSNNKNAKQFLIKSLNRFATKNDISLSFLDSPINQVESNSNSSLQSGVKSALANLLADSTNTKFDTSLARDILTTVYYDYIDFSPQAKLPIAKKTSGIRKPLREFIASRESLPKNDMLVTEDLMDYLNIFEAQFNRIGAEVWAPRPLSLVEESLKNLLPANQAKKLFLPINVSGNHWILLEIALNKDSAEFTVYNSLSINGKKSKYFKELATIVEKLKDVLVPKSVAINVGKMAQQTDGISCGDRVMQKILHCSGIVNNLTQSTKALEMRAAIIAGIRHPTAPAVLPKITAVELPKKQTPKISIDIPIEKVTTPKIVSPSASTLATKFKRSEFFSNDNKHAELINDYVEQCLVQLEKTRKAFASSPATLKQQVFAELDLLETQVIARGIAVGGQVEAAQKNGQSCDDLIKNLPLEVKNFQQTCNALKTKYKPSQVTSFTTFKSFAKGKTCAQEVREEGIEKDQAQPKSSGLI